RARSKSRSDCRQLAVRYCLELLTHCNGGFTMARHSGNRTLGAGGGGKIRLLWIDAELGGTDDVAQITQAIASALRPPSAQQPRLIAPAASTSNARMADGGDEVAFDETEEPSSTIEFEPSATLAAKPS